MVLSETGEEERTFVVECLENSERIRTTQQTARMSSGSAPPETLRRSRGDAEDRSGAA